MHNENKTLSKFLSLLLRHKPETIGLHLDENGWASVEELGTKTALHGIPLTVEKVAQIVATNDKKRFLFSEDKSRIRASQGHSIEVDLQLMEKAPPAKLFHGTATKNSASIKQQGLLKGGRHHVHLTTNKETAENVGARYGKPVLVEVDAAAMHRDGFAFYLSANNVWLTDHVPPTYLSIHAQEKL